MQIGWLKIQPGHTHPQQKASASVNRLTTFHKKWEVLNTLVEFLSVNWCFFSQLINYLFWSCRMRKCFCSQNLRKPDERDFWDHLTQEFSGFIAHRNHLKGSVKYKLLDLTHSPSSVILGQNPNLLFFYHVFRGRWYYCLEDHIVSMINLFFDNFILAYNVFLFFFPPCLLFSPSYLYQPPLSTIPFPFPDS